MKYTVRNKTIMNANKLASGICLALAVMPAMAQAPQPYEAKPKITKLALFKNGYGYVTLSVAPAENSKVVRITEMPAPAHGTFWYETNGKTSVALLAGKRVKSDETVPSYDMAGLAFANPGKEVEITTKKGAVIKGVIEMIGGKKDGKPSDAETQANFLGIKSAERITIIARDDIERVDFINADSLGEPKVEVTSPVLDIYLNQADASDPVRFSYITSGITWVPSYSLELGENDEGIFRAQAEIVNELGDIENADLELITGFPSIKFSTVPAPLFMRQPMSQFFNSLNNGGPGLNISARFSQPAMGLVTGGIRSGSGVMRKAQLDSVMMNSFAEEVSESAVPSATALSPADVTRAEDLFFYPVKGFSCARDETISIPLFSKKLPYEHIMTWDVPNTGQHANNINEIWHCVRITNTFDNPLTTAPIQFVSNGRFAGQDILKYTPQGKKGTVRISKAMDISGIDKENVKSQQPIDFLGYRRVKTTVDGELTATNYSGKPITIQVSKTLLGLVTNSSDESTSSQSLTMQDGMNPMSTIKWEATIPAGEKKTFAYSYTRLSN